MTSGRQRALACMLASCSVIWGLHGGLASAQETVGSQAVVSAVEQALVGAIDRAKKSVVSIARVPKAAVEAGIAEGKADIFPRVQPPGANGNAIDPTDPDFVPSAFATGVIIGPGLVLTNHHVLALGEPSDYYITTINQKVYKVKRIKGADPRTDLAVLEVEGNVDDKQFVPITFGDGAALRQGQIIISLGNPYAIARDGQASASWGIVANLQRKASAPPDVPTGSTADPINGVRKDTLHHLGTLIQTDAKLNLGTSGGALLNLKGEMVGLTTSIAAVAGFEGAAGYAIPVDPTFRRVLDRLKQGLEAEFAFLGVNLTSNYAFEAIQPDPITHGVRVYGVVPGAPAWKAEIRANDVITRVNDNPIIDRDSLMLHVGKLAPGSVAKVTIERDGAQQVKDVTLAKFAVHGEKVVTAAAPVWRGAQVDYPTAQEDFLRRLQAGDVFGEWSVAKAAEALSSVIVSEVAEDSPAWKAGLRRGTIISHVNDQRVDSPASFRRRVDRLNDAVTLRTVAGGESSPVITVPTR